MKTIIVLGCFCAIALLLLTSVTSVVAYQTVRINTKQIVQSVKTRSQEILSSLFRSKNEINTKIQTIQSEKQNTYNARVQSLLTHCSAFDKVAAATPSAQRLLFVLAATILTEFFVYLMMIKAPVVVLLFLSIIINVITNPAVNIVYYTVYNNVTVLEALVTIVESFLIYGLFNAASIQVSFPLAVFISLIANLASYIFASGLAQLVFGTSTSSSST